MEELTCIEPKSKEETKKLLCENLKRLFYEIDQNGSITSKQLSIFLSNIRGNMLEFDYGIPRQVVRRIYRLSDRKSDEELNFKKFYRKVSQRNLREFINYWVHRYKRFLFPRQPTFDGYSNADARYEDETSCNPPPLTMITFSIMELSFFLINNNMYTVAEFLQYDPRKRHEIWRFLTYMFVHIGTNHLVVNLAVQILLGLMLEVVHWWWQVALVYLSGVLAGSLLSSIVEPNANLVGASGGAYSFLTAHIATIIMNYNDMENPLVVLTIFLIVVCTDVGVSTYKRYVWKINDHVGYAAHFGGALAGLLVGIVVLRNIESTKWERILQKTSLIIFCALIAVMIGWNLFYTEYFLSI